MSQITSSGRSLMYSRKNVGRRMGPLGTPALSGHSCEDFPPKTTWSCLLLRRNRAKYLTWNSIRLKFAKKTSMLKHFKSFGYIKCQNSSSPRPVESSSNSIRYNCEKICSWLTRPKTILEIRKRPHFCR